MGGGSSAPTGGMSGYAGPGPKFQANYGGLQSPPAEKPKPEDPRQKEFGDVFSFAKEKLKDRIQHSQSKVDEYVTNY